MAVTIRKHNDKEASVEEKRLDAAICGGDKALVKMLAESIGVNEHKLHLRELMLFENSLEAGKLRRASTIEAAFLDDEEARLAATFASAKCARYELHERNAKIIRRYLIPEDLSD